MRSGAEDGLDLLREGRPEDGAGAGVGPDGLGEGVQRVELLGQHDGDLGRPAVPQRDPQQLLRVGPAVGRREMTEDTGAVQQNPQRAADVVRRRAAALAGQIGGDQAALRLVRRPLQGGQRPAEAGLHGENAVPAGESGVLTAPAAVDDDHVTVLEGLQGDRADQGRGAAAGLSDGQQMRFGGAAAGPPDDRRGVHRGVAVAHGDGARDGVRVGEAEDRLAGRGDEALGGDRRGEGVQHGHDEAIGLLVPAEVVLAAPAGLGVEQLLDPGAGGCLAVREVRRVGDPEAGEPPVLIEGVPVEGLRPVASVGEERIGVVGRGEVRHERLVQRPQARGLRLVGPGPHGGPLPPLPRGSAHHRDQGQDRPVRDERHHQHAGRAEEQLGTTPFLGGGDPLLPARHGQQPQSADHRDQRMEDIGGTVGGRARDLSAASDRSAAAAQNAGEWSPGHVGLLKGWERLRSVRT